MVCTTPTKYQRKNAHTSEITGEPDPIFLGKEKRAAYFASYGAEFSEHAQQIA